MTFQPNILLTHTYSSTISHFLYESLGICYQRYSTTRKNSCKTRCTLSVGVMRYLNQFQLSLHKIIIIITSLYTLLMPHLLFSWKSLAMRYSPQGQRKGSHGTRKKNSYAWQVSFHDQPMTTDRS